MPTVKRDNMTDQLFMLREQLEHTLSHLDSTNTNQAFFSSLALTITDKVQTEVNGKLSIEGAVTFEDLKSDSVTNINGAHIISGTVESTLMMTVTPLTDEIFNDQVSGDISTTDSLRFYLNEKLAGVMYTELEQILDSKNKIINSPIIALRTYGICNLFLESAYRASVEASEDIVFECGRMKMLIGRDGDGYECIRYYISNKMVLDIRRHSFGDVIIYANGKDHPDLKINMNATIINHIP